MPTGIWWVRPPVSLTGDPAAIHRQPTTILTRQPGTATRGRLPSAALAILASIAVAGCSSQSLPHRAAASSVANRAAGLRWAGAPAPLSTPSSPIPNETGPGSASAPEPNAAAPTGVYRQFVFGHSVKGASLTAVEIGDPRLPAVLVVGCIHGSEAAGTAVVDDLLASAPRSGVHLWLVRSLNPDGQAAGTRVNADGVDLNRNFPDLWRPLDPPGGLHYAGPHPLSEPESSAMATLLRQTRPRVGIWFHQALDLIDISQGPRNVENALAAALGVRERALADYPGSAIGYEDTLAPHSAFAFELPGGPLTPARAHAIAQAVISIGRSLPRS